MDVLWALGLGIFVSFLGCLPMAGPNAALIIQRLLDRQRASAFLVAVGAAVGETVYATAVAVPLPYALARYQALVPISRVAGAITVGAVGLFLIWRPTSFKAVEKPTSQASLTTGLAMAMFNPTLFATWTAVCATLYGNGLLATTLPAALAFALGVGIGAMVWFAALAWSVPYWAPHMRGQRQAWMMRGLGGVMVAAAIWLVIR